MSSICIDTSHSNSNVRISTNAYTESHIINKNIVRRMIARCTAVQTLYNARACAKNLQSCFNDFIQYVIPSNDFYDSIDINFYGKLINGYNDKIVNIVNQYFDSNRYKSINPICKDILTTAAIEMYYVKTKPTVVINEYIEIAKDFLDMQTVKYVNFALDSLYKNMERNIKQYIQEQQET